ncbi:invasion associated locus B family protein [Mesorhizobium sp. BR1-1-9]|uniref:invasion associated locus B family protein n=1 Tax=unclassified Mesorhizobium TaxID=325217 RepID=UPI001CD0C673|nr:MULTISPECIES: invasion associated locus B family protein [unclassified Mesorhizobium]MBZ9873195.1 invasion associated locus B family protein [Mesorhizobium sp. BR1-1-9]MBZ9944994.1 invasion associated locus B family protein [Mesorhizobium sp. BR1-1-13]
MNARLPEGATSLRAAHDDWNVACSVLDANGRNQKVCALSQELTDRKSHQRVLAIQMQPAGTGVEETLVLPFGLALGNGATLQADEGKPVRRSPSGLAFPPVASSR